MDPNQTVQPPQTGPQAPLPTTGVVSQGDQTAQTVPVAPSAPTSPSKLKEREPAGAVAGKTDVDFHEQNMAEADKVAKEEGDDYWENYAREIELEKEILEMGGVEKVESGEVKLPEKVALEMGIRPTTNIQTPMEAAVGFSIRNISLSDDQLSNGLTKPTSSGIRWLVEWFIYQLLKARYHIQRVKGGVIRSKSPV